MICPSQRAVDVQRSECFVRLACLRGLVCVRIVSLLCLPFSDFNHSQPMTELAYGKIGLCGYRYAISKFVTFFVRLNSVLTCRFKDMEDIVKYGTYPQPDLRKNGTSIPIAYRLFSSSMLCSCSFAAPGR